MRDEGLRRIDPRQEREMKTTKKRKRETVKKCKCHGIAALACPTFVGELVTGLDAILAWIRPWPKLGAANPMLHLDDYLLAITEKQAAARDKRPEPEAVRAINVAVAAEREACAVLAEARDKRGYGPEAMVGSKHCPHGVNVGIGVCPARCGRCVADRIRDRGKR